MPYKTEWVAPEVLLEHNGVKVFHTYKDGDSEQPYAYWYTLNEDYEDFADVEFDVRELSTWTKDSDNPEGIKKAIREAIDKGELKLES